MAEENTACTHDCSTCGANCPSRNKESMLEKPNKNTHINKIVAVVSGKGGVGKSLVTSLLAASSQKSGKQVGILDADITGPSIPKIFGCKSEIFGDGEGMTPPETASGLKLISVNLMLEDETTPVVWRGPVIAGTVKQFWTDVSWGNLDCLYIDMPPGTGDVPLTIFQSVPVNGIIIVTSPQDLVSMIVGKAVNMAKMMNIPIIGIVENYSYFECPNCNEKHYIFGKSNLEAVAEQYDIPILARIPIDPDLARLCDRGEIETIGEKEEKYIENAVKAVLE
ncbi:MAG: Mrp/NBP35 family ATP-binding protein [Clostridia bacterium]|nr:Mrp/NBP35 family ATP-binding protein [Clostridia bacterium]